MIEIKRQRDQWMKIDVQWLHIFSLSQASVAE
jgi:hypothetical protein